MNTNRLTFILAPHPDDEVIRLAHYTAIAADRGDNVVTVTATDGSATSVAASLGLTPREVAEWRLRELIQANEWLTDNRGYYGQLHIRDGGATANAVYVRMSALIGDYMDILDIPRKNVEIYVATCPPNHKDAVAADQHVDHKACAAAGAMFSNDGYIVRYALHPTATGRPTSYTSRTHHQELRVRQAVNCYATIGQRSTPASLRAVPTTPNRIVR